MRVPYQTALNFISFSFKQIPEYSRTLEEKEIVDNAFNLIFAFDEIVALGYRESVNLSQIKTFVEMDSHEEKVYQAVRQTQEREAKQRMREKAKELQRARMESQKKGLGMGRGTYSTGSSEGFGNSGGISGPSNISNSMSMGMGEITKPAPSKPAPSRNALKLGGKNRDVDSFVDQLKSEGQNVTNLTPAAVTSAISKPKVVSDVHTEAVHLKMEDKLTIRMGKDGGVQQFELSGMLTLRITDEKYGRIRVQLENNDQRGIQLQTHPNVDKELFKSKHQIGLKNPAKPFPMNTDVGVLKWRLQTTDESALPLTSKLIFFDLMSPFSLKLNNSQLIAGHRRTAKVDVMSISSMNWNTQDLN